MRVNTPKSPRHIAVDILCRVRKDGAFSDISLNNQFAKHDLALIDKAFISELIHGSIRWRGRLEWLVTQFYQGDYKTCPLPIKAILETGLYQIDYMTKTPGFAAVNEAVSLAKKLKGQYWANRVNAILRTYLRNRASIQFPDEAIDPIKAISVGYSHPEWMVKRWIERYGIEETRSLCSANNKIPNLTLRINPMQTTPANLMRELEDAGIAVENEGILDNFVKLKKATDLTTLVSFNKGQFSVQDISAGLVGILADPWEGELIIDMCAAPGGKTTHLAEMTRCRSRIIAIDRSWQRLNLLRQNVQRLGLYNIHLVQADATTVAARQAHLVLLDTPCSGLGVLSKRSDLRWKRNETDIKDLAELQLLCLENASRLVIPGGHLIYSTCTIEPEENEEIIEKFLARHRGYSLVLPPSRIPEKFVTDAFFIRTFPHKHEIDGSFAVKLQRNA
ncbi:16S rRNA (cytosine(967)-C(5))-methyltransferase RsmB [candidate division KSB1 bacterium]|nr:16S rRNA (cytosine(967)-C(5))-methyltransferase RsmB [candidate division KSB1 bacterium]